LIVYKPVNGDLMVIESQGSLAPILKLPLLGDRPCLDFINTIDWRLHPKKRRDTFESYSDLLAFSLRLNLITTTTYSTLTQHAISTPLFAERAFNDARVFRDALTRLVDDITARSQGSSQDTPSLETLAIIDTARHRAHESESLVWSGDRLDLSPRPEKEGLDLPWLIIVRDAERLLCSDLASHIRVCAGNGCGWVFIDTSKNGTRRWCSMKYCGNREKAARFKAKGGKN
jgi:predicted RNA-binding Zn ribbon-like protein